MKLMFDSEDLKHLILGKRATRKTGLACMRTVNSFSMKIQ